MINMLNILGLLLAQSPSGGSQGTVDLNPTGSFANLKNLTIPSLISGLIRLTLLVAAIVFFFILVVGGIKWIISGGDKAQTEAARNQITAALVGLVIVFAAWAIAKLIETFFGVNILQVDIPKL